ncbi:MAG: ferritin-like domain-containing protein [Polyangiaceae bacterium]
MHASGSKRLNEETRAKIVASLNARLADGIDLYTQIKVAHWNIKGPHFAALHPLFDSYASSLADFNDEIAERLVTLGGHAHGSARQIPKASTLPEWPEMPRKTSSWWAYLPTDSMRTRRGSTRPKRWRAISATPRQKTC